MKGMSVLSLLNATLKFLKLLDGKSRLNILQNSCHLTNQPHKLPGTRLIFLPLRASPNTYLFVKSSYFSTLVAEETVFQIYSSWFSQLYASDFMKNEVK